MQVSLGAMFAFVAALAVLFFVARWYLNADIMRRPTVEELEKLNLSKRFQDVSPTMNDEAVFRVVGLSRYHRFLD